MRPSEILVQVSVLDPSRRAVHCCWLCHLRESAPCCGGPDPHTRGHSRRLGHHADYSGLQYEGGDTLDLGALFQRDYSTSRPRDPCTLAGFKPLHSRAFPRDRSDRGARDNRVSLTIDHDVSEPMAITGLSMAEVAQPVTDPTEVAK